MRRRPRPGPAAPRRAVRRRSPPGTNWLRCCQAVSTSGVSHSQPNSPPRGQNAQRGKGGGALFLSLLTGRSSIAVRAGLRVSELNAEMIVDTAMVRANWRKKLPVMPLMNAHGTNTALSTRPTAMTGPDTCSMARMVASRGVMPCSMWCSTASTTTMASSTTMPMASTSPNSVRLFRLKPRAAMTANVPMMATGTAISGMTAERQFCRNVSTTRATRMTASRSVLKTSWMHSRV